MSRKRFRSITTWAVLSTALASWQVMPVSGATAQSLITIGPGIVGAQTLNRSSYKWQVEQNTTIDAGTGSYGINIVVNSVTTVTGGPILINTTNATGLLVQNVDTLATMNAGTVITVHAGTGGTSDWSGVRVIAGGTAALNGVKVETFGSAASGSLNANGLFANGNGSAITATNTTVFTHGDYAYGVNAANNGKVTLTGGSIDTSGNFAFGASTATGAIDMTGGGTKITTAGDNGRGLYATGTGSITANGLTVSTSGANAYGAFALVGGSIDLGTNSSITTSGSDAYGITANGAGTTLALGDGGSVTTNGMGAWGVRAVSGGKVNLTGTTSITTFGGPSASTTGAFGMIASGNGSTVSTGIVIVNTAGTGAYGAFADSGGRITIGDGSTIDTGGAAAHGVNATGVDGAGNGSLVTVGRGVVIETQAAGADGVVAFNGGKVDMSAGGAQVTTNGLLADALFATSGSGIPAGIVAGDIAITTRGGVSDGARADTGSSITLSGNSTIDTSAELSNGVIAITGGSIFVRDAMQITTAGSQSAGAVVDGASSVLSFQGDNSIVTTGAAAPAILVRNGAQLTFDNVTNFLPSLTVEGAQSALLAAQNPGSILNIGPGVAVRNGGDYAGVFGAMSRTGSTVSFAPGSLLELTSPDSPALATAAGGNIMLDGATVSSSGSGASYGLLATFGSASAPNTLTMTGGATLTSAQAAALRADGAVLQVAVDGSRISGASLAESRAGSAVDIAASSGSLLEGDAFAGSTSTLNINLAASRWRGAAANVTGVNVGAASLWTMTGSSTVGQVSNAGEIDFTPPSGDPAQSASYKMLTATDYAGAGGTINLNTYLGTDGSPSDRLVVNGGAGTGNSVLVITNTAGTGAYTFGDGILVVQALNGATTSADAFALGNHVIVGPHEYLLFHGGDAATGGNPGDQNWYLRNVFTPAPTPDDLFPEPVPIFQPAVPVSMVIPPLALEYGYAILDTLHERVGETYRRNAAPVTEERVVWCKDPKTNFRCVVRVPVSGGGDGMRWAQSGWARVIGDRGLHQPDNFLRRGSNYDYTFWGIQAGLDLFAREQAGGTLDKAGIYIGYGEITSDVRRQFGGKAGSVDMDAYTLGGYWTHFSPNGWYTDAVIQGTWYSTDAKSVNGQQLKPDGFGILASLEGGYAFKLGAGWTIEPQAQIVYQNVSFDNTSDYIGFVRFDDGDSLRGRLGLRVTRSWNMADEIRPRLLTAWLRANVWHEFLGKTRTSWGTAEGSGLIPFHSYLGGTWGEIGAGVTAQVADTVNLFATGAYNRSLDNKGRQGWDGRLGMTVNW